MFRNNVQQDVSTSDSTRKKQGKLNSKSVNKLDTTWGTMGEGIWEGGGKGTVTRRAGGESEESEESEKKAGTKTANSKPAQFCKAL